MEQESVTKRGLFRKDTTMRHRVRLSAFHSVVASDRHELTELCNLIESVFRAEHKRRLIVAEDALKGVVDDFERQFLAETYWTLP